MGGVYRIVFLMEGAIPSKAVRRLPMAPGAAILAPMGELWAAIPPKEYLEDFFKECSFHGLQPEQLQDLFLFEGFFVPLAWADQLWPSVERLSFSSIGDCVKKLKPLAKVWHHQSGSHHRRGELVLKGLRSHRAKALSFPSAPLKVPAAFTLESQESLLYCLEPDRPMLTFAGNKTAPSRAYLKLWEGLSIAGVWPKAGERCLELGASPGGWTWVIAALGASVLAVDRSPLAPEVAAMPGVEFRSGDAFGYSPEKVGEIDWLFSDLICYPEKLLEFVKLWIASGKAKNYFCTIKFQGEADPAIIGEFQKIGRVVHLRNNKHELSWMRLTQ